MILDNGEIVLKSIPLIELEEMLENDFKNVNYEILEEQKNAIIKKILKMKSVAKELHDWYTYWYIIKNNEITGMIGFKGINNQELEIGYGISKRYEGKGYITNAIKIIVDWAFSHGNIKTIKASKVLRNNHGSQRVLEKNGFKMIGKDSESFYYIRNRG